MRPTPPAPLPPGVPETVAEPAAPALNLSPMGVPGRPRRPRATPDATVNKLCLGTTGDPTPALLPAGPAAAPTAAALGAALVAERVEGEEASHCPTVFSVGTLPPAPPPPGLAETGAGPAAAAFGSTEGCGRGSRPASTCVDSPAEIGTVTTSSMIVSPSAVPSAGVLAAELTPLDAAAGAAIGGESAKLKVSDMSSMKGVPALKQSGQSAREAKPLRLT